MKDRVPRWTASLIIWCHSNQKRHHILEVFFLKLRIGKCQGRHRAEHMQQTLPRSHHNYKSLWDAALKLWTQSSVASDVNFMEVKRRSELVSSSNLIDEEAKNCENLWRMNLHNLDQNKQNIICEVISLK